MSCKYVSVWKLNFINIHDIICFLLTIFSCCFLYLIGNWAAQTVFVMYDIPSTEEYIILDAYAILETSGTLYHAGASILGRHQVA